MKDGLCIHLENGGAVTQMAGLPFVGLMRFGGQYYGCGPDGLYRIGGKTDDGEAIAAAMKTPETDFGIPNPKKLRIIHLGASISAGGSLVVSTTNDGDNQRDYCVESAGDDRSSDYRCPIGRDGRGRYWSIEITNQDGADFSLDSIEVGALVLARGRGW